MHEASLLAVDSRWHLKGITCCLAKTVKGWALGEGFLGKNVTHQLKKMNLNQLNEFRDRLEFPISDRQLEDAPYYHPGPNSPEIRYMLERRRALGGFLPKRVVRCTPLPLPEPGLYDEFKQGTGTGREVSTTMAFVRLLRQLLQGNRQAHCAHHSRRGENIRHGFAVPRGRELFHGRPALRIR
jgi:pyruvate dehydrogenase E1 component